MALSALDVEALEALRTDTQEWSARQKARLTAEVDLLEGLGLAFGSARSRIEEPYVGVTDAELGDFFFDDSLESLGASNVGLGGGSDSSSNGSMLGVDPDVLLSSELLTPSPLRRAIVGELRISDLASLETSGVMQFDAHYSGARGARRRVNVTVPRLPFSTTPAVIVVLPGAGSWDVLKEPWLIYAAYWGARSYIVLYLEILNDSVLASDDLARAVSWVRTQVPGLRSLGFIASGSGSFVALDAAIRYPTEVDLVALIGPELDTRGRGWTHGTLGTFSALGAAIFTQSGDGDRAALTSAVLLRARLMREQPSLVRYSRAYTAARRGFQFLTTTAGNLERADLAEVLHWQLRNGPKPEWWP